METAPTIRGGARCEIPKRSGLESGGKAEVRLTVSPDWWEVVSTGRYTPRIPPMAPAQSGRLTDYRNPITHRDCHPAVGKSDGFSDESRLAA